MADRMIGVIGGTGLYEMKGFKKSHEVAVKTPFGKPSDKIVIGHIEGVKMAFLPRHGRGHFILPSEINYRANIWAMKKLGVEFIISSAACGSLREGIRPGDIVIVDQFFDRTKRRIDTFMGNGVVGHLVFPEPTCPSLAGVLYQASKSLGIRTHKAGTYICIEGPSFSTRAESRTYQKWGADVVGMTNLTEAKLALEAEICYATVALCTDYDCWHESREPVTIGEVIRVMNLNVEHCRAIIRKAVSKIPELRECRCVNAMQYAVVTAPEKIPAKTKRDLKIIIGKYLTS
jgi:5'-methylthioadenosine phosphorylase